MYKSTRRYLKNGSRTGMTIMDIGVFSGFTPDKDSLIEVNNLIVFCVVRYTFNYTFTVKEI